MAGGSDERGVSRSLSRGVARNSLLCGAGEKSFTLNYNVFWLICMTDWTLCACDSLLSLSLSLFLSLRLTHTVALTCPALEPVPLQCIKGVFHYGSEAMPLSF